MLIAFIPAVLLGLAFGSFIKARLFHAVPVAVAFVVGAVIILWVEARHRRDGAATRAATGRRASRPSIR